MQGSQHKVWPSDTGDYLINALFQRTLLRGRGEGKVCCANVGLFGGTQCNVLQCMVAPEQCIAMYDNRARAEYMICKSSGRPISILTSGIIIDPLVIHERKIVRYSGLH